MNSQDPQHDLEKASTTPGLPLSLGIGPLIEKADVEHHPRALDVRSLLICALCMGLAAVVAPVARLLMLLIGATIYSLLTPYKEIHQIREGNSATDASPATSSRPRAAPSAPGSSSCRSSVR